MGVSRQHLLIRRSKQGYEAIDLGSANGTYLYRRTYDAPSALPPSPCVFLRLGKLRLFVTFRFSEKD